MKKNKMIKRRIQKIILVGKKKQSYFKDKIKILRKIMMINNKKYRLVAFNKLVIKNQNLMQGVLIKII